MWAEKISGIEVSLCALAWRRRGFFSWGWKAQSFAELKPKAQPCAA